MTKGDTDNGSAALLCRSIIENSIDMIVAVDPGRRIVAFNRAACETFGYDRAEIIGQTVEVLYHDPEEAARIGREVRENGAFSGEIRNVRKDGGVFTSFLSASCLRDDEGRAIGAVGNSRDITLEKEREEELRQSRGRLAELVGERTAELEKANRLLHAEIAERKETERLLRESEARFREMAELLPLVVFELDTGGRLTYANRRGFESTGLTADEFDAGINVRDLFADSDRERALANIAKIMAGEPFDDQLYTVRRADGSTFPALVYSTPIRDDDGTVTGIRGALVDITARRAAESELRLLSASIAQADTVVVITDADGSIEFVNPAFERTTGYTREEVIGKNPRVLKSGRHSPAFYRTMWETISGGTPWSGTFINRRRDGSLMYEEAHIAPVMENGAIRHYVAVKRDITRQRELETNMANLRREYEAFMRHEIKNILGPIKGFSDLLLMSGTERMTGRQQEFISRINTATSAAIELIDSLKKLQDIESGQFDLETIPLDAAQVLREKIGDIMVTAGGSGVTITLDSGADDTIVSADPSLLPGVFTNLLKNAVEHVLREKRPDAKTVTVTTRNEDGGLVITINNRGEPVPPQKLATFFEKFNSDRSRKKDGMGLGTTYALLVTRAHGGDITVTSNAVDGTTVSLTLPTIM